MSFLTELKRRNVLRVGAAYVVVAWLLIQVAETIFPLFGLGNTPARVVVIVLAIGFIPALIFAWVFELTPEGFKKERDLDRGEAADAYNAGKLDRLIIVVLVVAVTYFAVDKFVFSGSREAAVAEKARLEGRAQALIESYADKSIAVLPFADMSAERDQEYFSEGIAEEVLNLLAKIPDLRVISRTSAFAFKNQNLSMGEIAERLNASHILEGSVRKSGDEVRITAQLIDARTDRHLWSQTWNRADLDVFAIQEEIAAEVARGLQLTLLGAGPTVRETDPEAYTMFLEARQLGRQHTAEALDQSNALLDRVLTIDSGYAPAWVALASNYLDQAGYGWRPVEEGYELARKAAQRAVSMDPDYAPAHLALADIALTFDNDPAAAASRIKRALSLSPFDSYTHSYAALLLSYLGRPNEAVSLLEYVLKRDPLDPLNHHNLGFFRIHAGQPVEAIDAFRTALRLKPEMQASHYGMGKALLLQGKPDRALEMIQKEPFEVFQLLGKAMAYHAMGRTDQSDHALDALIEHHAQDWAVNIAMVLAFRGEADRAFGWLERAQANKDPGLADIHTEPLFANLHDDPRWLPLLENLGKSPAQLAAIEFNAKLPS